MPVTKSRTACVEVPPHVLHRDVQLLDAGHQLVVTLLADTAADDLANLREEHIGALHGLAIGILLHIKSFDFLRIVYHDDRLAEMFFHQETFVLARQVATPINGEFKLMSVGNGFFQDLDTLRIGQTDKLGVHHTLQAPPSC